VQNRPSSPSRLLIALLVACLAPLGVGAATGLAGGPLGDQIETADGGGRDRDDRRDLADRSDDGDGDSASSGSSTSGLPTTTVPPSTAAPTTTTTAPPATAPPSTDPPAPPPTPAPTTPPAAPAPTPADEVVALANAARADAGCGALRNDAQLAAAAKGHSDDMAANGYFSHTSQDGRSFADRIEAAGYSGSPGGENIAQGQRSPQEVHDAWMNSEGHRRNILDCNFNAIGVGLHAGSWTWTQNFGY
jgi:uncharacterized protein YkwD